MQSELVFEGHHLEILLLGYRVFKSESHSPLGVCVRCKGGRGVGSFGRRFLSLVPNMSLRALVTMRGLQVRCVRRQD